MSARCTASKKVRHLSLHDLLVVSGCAGPLLTIETPKVLDRLFQRLDRQPDLLKEIQASCVSSLVVVYLRSELPVLPRQLFYHLREAWCWHLLRRLQSVWQSLDRYRRAVVVGNRDVDRCRGWWCAIDAWLGPALTLLVSLHIDVPHGRIARRQ